MKNKSLGLIETYGFVPAIVAADTAMKTANVKLLACLLTSPARLTIQFSGDVAAVQTAVMAAKAAAEKVGRVISAHVIARPSDGLLTSFSEDSTGSFQKLILPCDEKESSKKISPCKSKVMQSEPVTKGKDTEATFSKSEETASPKSQAVAKKGRAKKQQTTKSEAGEDGSGKKESTSLKKSKKKQVAEGKTKSLAKSTTSKTNKKRQKTTTKKSKKGAPSTNVTTDTDKLK